MKIKPLSPSIIVAFQDVYVGNPIENRIEYLRGIPKETLITIFSLINLHPAIRGFASNIEGDDQLYLLGYLLEGKPFLVNRIQSKIESKYQRLGSKPVIFSRAANVFALEEIIKAEFRNEQELATSEIDSENILKYYLCVNAELNMTQQNRNPSEDLSPFERILANISTTSELVNTSHPFMEIARGIRLHHYLKNHPEYGEAFKNYFESIGHKPELVAGWVLKHVLSILNSPESTVPYFTHSNSQDKDLLEKYSQRSDLQGFSTLEAVNIKKSPFFKLNNGRYCLMDVFFLIDKACYSLINDFYFDKVKALPGKLGRRDYFYGQFGLFTENYVVDQLKNAFVASRSNVVLGTDELKINIRGSSVELADVYIRNNKKILLGQVKASALPSREKFSHEGLDFFKSDKDKFYSTFGVKQLVEQTLGKIDYFSEVDSRFPVDKKIQIFPCVIGNERVLNSPLASLAFNEYFRDKLKDEFENEIHIPLDPFHEMILRDKIHIKPLMVFSLIDIEVMAAGISLRGLDLWKSLRGYLKSTQLQSPYYYYQRSKKRVDYAKYSLDHALPLLDNLQYE